MAARRGESRIRRSPAPSSLRFYGWSAANAQPRLFSAAVRPPFRPAPGRPAVAARPTGGAAWSTTTSYLRPRPADRAAVAAAGESWLARMHAIVAEALADLAARPDGVVEESKYGEILCFLHHTPGDLRIGRAKVVGTPGRRLGAAATRRRPAGRQSVRRPCRASPSCPAVGSAATPLRRRSRIASPAAPAGAWIRPTGPRSSAAASTSWRRRSTPIPPGTPGANNGQNPAASGALRGRGVGTIGSIGGVRPCPSERFVGRPGDRGGRPNLRTWRCPAARAPSAAAHALLSPANPQNGFLLSFSIVMVAAGATSKGAGDFASLGLSVSFGSGLAGSPSLAADALAGGGGHDRSRRAP